MNEYRNYREFRTTSGQPEEIAKAKALQEVGLEPADVSDEELNEYWDRYYDAYYSHLDQIMDECFGPNEPYNDFEIEYDFDDNTSYKDNFNESELEEFQSSLKALLEALNKPMEAENGLAFFRDPKAREEVFEFSKVIAEYIKTHKIKDLVIADRSSRPLYIGVMEYWKKVYPNEKMPGIYFVNPKGFRNKESYAAEELERVQVIAEFKGDRPELPEARTEEEIIREFEKVYPRLMDDKKDPVLIFDTCIHSGDTLESVVRAFKKTGFENVMVGSVNPADRNSKVKTDFYITHERPEGGCYPFDRDRMIEKTFEHVYSQPSSDTKKRAAAVALREEIRKIMKERLG